MSRTRHPNRLIVLAAVSGLFVLLFFGALFRSGVFVFRDAGHFYYPLFKLVADEWAAGRAPLWNPYENLGQPLAGNPTASVFYPGKLIFALPIGYAWAYKIYITGHVLLAAWGAYRFARHIKAGVAAAGICAISYAFSGNVLFQYCNVVFLVSAAWLPLAMLATDGMLVKKSLRWAVAFGAAMAMMVLGGDPQMAYNAGLLAILYALLLWFQKAPARSAGVRAATAEPTPPQNEEPPHAVRGLFARISTCCGLFIVAVVVALMLSAIQVLPSLELTRRSNRRAPALADRFFATLEPGAHSEHTYHFSVGPWRLAEYVWPNVSGRQFPVHHRWLGTVPAEGRVWTPSLYMGILPLLLAVSAMRWRRGEPRDRWLTWLVTLAVIAALGYYSLGWLMLEMRLETGLGGPFGGLYWLMTLLLPGYAAFRYPAKLLVVAALGLSALAGRGWDEAFDGSPARVRRLLLVFGGLSLIAAMAALGVRPFWDGWLAGVPPDMLFGPLDTAGAFRDLLFAFLQTAVLSGLFWWLLRQKQRASPAAWAPIAVLILVAVDLAVANRWMIACAPANQWEEPSKLAQAIKAHAVEETAALPPRVYRHSIWMPPAWEKRGSPGRLADAMRWDRDTLWPKYNLLGRISVIRVDGTMRLADYEEFLRTGSGGDALPPGVDALDAGRLAEWVIMPGNKSLPGGKRVETGDADASLWHNPDHLPRAWISRSSSPAESCSIVHFDPLRVEIEAELTAPGTVVLCEQYYPGWTLDVTTAGQTRRVPILPANSIMRGVPLPAGSHRLLFRYRPASFLWGAILSGLAWVALIVWGGVSWFARRRRAGGG